MKNLLTIAAILSIITIACSKAEHGSAESFKQAALEKEALTTTSPEADSSRQIIKTADIEYEVKDNAAYYKYVQQLLIQYNGYISKEENINNEYQEQVVCTIKVPVAHFDNLLNALPVADARQVNKTIGTDDVTAQLVDAGSRLVAKKAVRDKYLSFLGNAKTIDDMLRVQKEIDVIQEDIEAAEGMLAHLSSQTVYSTIHLSFYKSIQTPAGSGFGSKIVVALKTGTDIIAILFLGALTIWPLLAIAVLVFYWYKRRKPASKVVA